MAAPTINDDFPGWLEATAALHNGHGWAKFREVMAMRDQPPLDPFVRFTVQAAAELFGVHRHTMQDWIRRYNRGYAPQNNTRPAV